MGRALAGKLKMKLIDSDKLIERTYGKKLQEIIDEIGVDAFRKIEEDTLLSIEGENLIISTGGSAVYSEKAMAHLKAQGRVVYLRLTFEEMDRRLGDLHARGVAIAPGATLMDLYNERVPLYEKYADITVSIRNGNSVRQSLQYLLRQV
jgi:shikimate kinase